MKTIRQVSEGETMIWVLLCFQSGLERDRATQFTGFKVKEAGLGAKGKGCEQWQKAN